MDWRTEAQELADELRRRGIRDPRVLQRIAQVPRHLFVPPELRSNAYADHALGIGCEQTISQPYIVALMTEAAEVGVNDRVLEIGTGSGYQAAILAGLCEHLSTIERIRLLAERAREVWGHLGLYNILSIVGDGTLGWPEGAPYDAILVTAGAPAVPAHLIDQLADAGRLVIPVGPESAQELLLLRRFGEQLSESKLCDCRFVKLLGDEGWSLKSAPTDADDPA